MPGIAIGNPAEIGQPDALRAAVAEFFSMVIFVFAGQGSGMAYSKPPTLVTSKHLTWPIFVKISFLMF